MQKYLSIISLGYFTPDGMYILLGYYYNRVHDPKNRS